MQSADLLIVMGTSLTVQPFASLAGMVKESCPRVLINLDHVGDFGSRADDVILLGKCDEIVMALSKELDWEKELLRLWEQTEASVLLDDEPKETGVPAAAETTNKRQEPDELKDVTAKMAHLMVDAAEREGVSTSKLSGSKLPALNQAEIPEKPSTEKISSSDLQETIVDAIPTNEQNVSSEETKAGGDNTSPLANEKL
jgi:NAD-dependent histone deacetylase SIR2